MKIIIISFLSLLLLNCTLIHPNESKARPECEGSYFYDPNDFPNHINDIGVAQDRFNKFVGRNVVSIKAHDGKCELDKDKINKQHAIGEYSLTSGRIVLDIDKMSSSTIKEDILFQAALLHEMGHSFGFNHIGDTGNVMSVHISLQFTNEDKEECQRAELCENDSLQ